MQAPTPAPVPQNDAVDDDDEEPLNENDDDDLDDVDQGEDLNTAHLVLAQFDKVFTLFLSHLQELWFVWENQEWLFLLPFPYQTLFNIILLL